MGTVKKIENLGDLKAPPVLDATFVTRLKHLAHAVDSEGGEKLEKILNYQEYAIGLGQVLETFQKTGIQKMIPANDTVIKHSWHDRLGTDIELGRTIAVRGDAGNGKSTGVKHVLTQLGYKIYHLDCTDSTTTEQLVGGLQPKSDGKGGIKLVYVDGIVTRAFKDPKGALQLDEFDALDPRVAMALQSALHRSNGKPRWLSAPDHPKGGLAAKGDCPIVVTMNTWGSGANREYVGRNILDAASMDRFNSVIDTTYENETEMLKMAGVGEEDASKIVNHAKKLRQIINENALRIVLSTRRLLDIGEAVTALKCSHDGAWERDFYTRIQPEILETIKKKL